MTVTQHTMDAFLKPKSDNEKAKQACENEWHTQVQLGIPTKNDEPPMHVVAVIGSWAMKEEQHAEGALEFLKGVLVSDFGGKKGDGSEPILLINGADFQQAGAEKPLMYRAAEMAGGIEGVHVMGITHPDNVCM